MEEKGLVERLCDAKQKCGECVPFDEPCPVAEGVYDRHNAELNKEIAKVLEGLHEDYENRDAMTEGYREIIDMEIDRRKGK